VTWLLLVVSSVVFVELFSRFKTIQKAKDVLAVVNKVTKVVGSRRISDHWKEKVLLIYAQKLFGNSMVLFVFLAIAFSPFFIAIYISYQFGFPFAELLMSLIGVIGATGIAISYSIVRSHLG